MSYEEEKQDRKIEQLEAEIERLRADNAGLSKAVISIQEERDLAQAEFRAYHKAWEDQAAEIERPRVELASANVELLAAGELVTQLNQAREAEIDQAGAAERIYVEAARLKDARIQELEEALVDARGKLFHQFGDAELDPPGEDDRRIVQEMLRAEGKIGPDASESHLRPYEVVAADLAGMMAKSWQITDERKAALEHILICHHCRYDDSGCKAPDVLRAMLEAGQ